MVGGIIDFGGSSSSSSSGMTFTLLNLLPTYSTISSNGWVTAPTNLNAIYDGDPNTSTNTFEVGGTAWTNGDIIISPGILIPGYSLIQCLVGITTNNNGMKPGAQLDYYANGWITCWSLFGQNFANNSALTQYTISVIVPAWTQLRWRIWDTGNYGTRSAIYDLKVYSAV